MANRKYIDSVLAFAGKICNIKGLIKLSGINLIAPFYHAISNEAPPHLKHLYPIKNEADFRSDLSYLLKHFEPIDISELADHVLNRKTCSKPKFFLSFDDGLREFKTVIAPVLLEMGIPATCFLNSGFTDNKNLFYRYKNSLLVDAVKKSETLTEVFESGNMLDDSWHPKHLKQRILQLGYQAHEERDRLAGLLEVDFDQYLKSHQPYLNSTEIESLAAQGFTFGGHSIDHPKYCEISLTEQQKQTAESVAFAKQLNEGAPASFSFPFTDFGVSKRYFEWQQQKYPSLISFGCAGIKQDFGHHQQRIPFEKSGLNADEILKAEYLYYLLKAPFGKNKILRF